LIKAFIATNFIHLSSRGTTPSPPAHGEDVSADTRRRRNSENSATDTAQRQIDNRCTFTCVIAFQRASSSPLKSKCLPHTRCDPTRRSKS